MNYNIRHGFHTGKNPFTLQNERVEAAKKAVENQKPDILALTEACFGHKNKYGIHMNYQKVFDYPYYYHAPSINQGYEWGTAILSRYPIVARNLTDTWKMMLKAQIDVKGETINVGVTHQAPKVKGNEKEEFFEKHLKDFQIPYILAGDFNSISPQDPYDRTKLIRGFKTFTKEPEKVVDAMLNDPTIPYLLSQGLIDTYRQRRQSFGFTVPTDSLSSNKDSGIRLDYIFCSLDFKVKNA